MRNKLLALLIIVITFSLIGCSKDNNKSDIDEYFKLKEDFSYFITKVYDASSNLDIANGKEAIRGYLTESAYKTLESELGEYNDVDSEITDLVVSYIKKENSTNNLFDKVNVTFRIINGNRSQLHAIEFIKDNSGLFNRYNIFKGIIEER